MSFKCDMKNTAQLSNNMRLMLGKFFVAGPRWFHKCNFQLRIKLQKNCFCFDLSIVSDTRDCFLQTSLENAVLIKAENRFFSLSLLSILFFHLN